MYQWYKNAEVCFAYLSDVPRPDPLPDLDAFCRARWFSRGWCLQELIAPREVEFFAADWTEIGTKDSLKAIITQITGITTDVLSYADIIPCKSAAERMSWASTRETSREEDMAYCLFGLFNVNLPLLYGEGGTRAFLRLQEEILIRTLDLTLLLWCSSSIMWRLDASTGGFEPSRPVVSSGALCAHPLYFPSGGANARSGGTLRYSDLPQATPYPDIGYITSFPPPQIIGQYLKLSLMTAPYGTHGRIASIARLESGPAPVPQHVCIILNEYSEGSGEYERRYSGFLELTSELPFSKAGWKIEEIHLRLHRDSVVPGPATTHFPPPVLKLRIFASDQAQADRLLVASPPKTQYEHHAPRQMISSSRLDVSEESFWQPDMFVPLDALQTAPSEIESFNFAIRILISARDTSVLRLMASLVVYPFRSYGSHWVLRRWDADRPLDEADLDVDPLQPGPDPGATCLTSASDRMVIWIPDLEQCLQISRKRRLDQYFLRLVLSRWDRGYLPEGAQELRARSQKSVRGEFISFGST